MSAALVPTLTLAEFDRQYGNQPGWEYWFGEAVRKPVPTIYHALLTAILSKILLELGYVGGPEVDLKIDPNWQPRPDLIAVRRITGPYPKEPVDTVIEILSDDQFQWLLTKCAHYARTGNQRIFVLDPEGHRIWRWDANLGNLVPANQLEIGTHSVEGARIWAEFDRAVRSAQGE